GLDRPVARVRIEPRALRRGGRAARGPHGLESRAGARAGGDRTRRPDRGRGAGDGRSGAMNERENEPGTPAGAPQRELGGGAAPPRGERGGGAAPPARHEVPPGAGFMNAIRWALFAGLLLVAAISIGSYAMWRRSESKPPGTAMQEKTRVIYQCPMHPSYTS